MYMFSNLFYQPPLNLLRVVSSQSAAVLGYSQGFTLLRMEKYKSGLRSAKEIGVHVCAFRCISSSLL